MINQDASLFDLCIDQQVFTKDVLLETYHQSKIIDYLEGLGFEVIKIITANRAGNADVVACSKEGQFWKIEVKRYNGMPSKLQLAKLRRFWNNKAVCMIAYGFDDFKMKYKLLTG